MTVKNRPLEIWTLMQKRPHNPTTIAAELGITRQGVNILFHSLLRNGNIKFLHNDPRLRVFVATSKTPGEMLEYPRMRWKIWFALRRKRWTAADLAQEFEVSHEAMERQLRLMRKQGSVEMLRGRVIPLYRATDIQPDGKRKAQRQAAPIANGFGRGTFALQELWHGHV